MHGFLQRVMPFALTLFISGCASTEGVGYYWQAVLGHLELVQKARPVDELLKDGSLHPQLRGKLQVAQIIRTFASNELGLPDNRSYRQFSDLGRPYVVWNVFATPPLSITLTQWCFPIAGCVNYRGYYSEADAKAYAVKLASKGLDVHIGGVPAYSTLGWMPDPLLSTFMHYSEPELARLIFHELAHQRFYLPGNTNFNESFATAVEREGIRRWLERRADPGLRTEYEQFERRRRDFLKLLSRYQAKLDLLYQSDRPDDEKLAQKSTAFAEMRDQYLMLKEKCWGGYKGYDRWFERPLTNASLASVGAYTQWVPAFERLLLEQDRNLSSFYSEVERMADLSPDDLLQRLRDLAPETVGDELDREICGSAG